jgi:hypothetical protein
MTGQRVTAILASLTLLVLVLSLPGSLRDAFNRDGNSPRHPEWAGRRAGGTAAVSSTVCSFIGAFGLSS